MKKILKFLSLHLTQFAAILSIILAVVLFFVWLIVESNSQQMTTEKAHAILTNSYYPKQDNSLYIILSIGNLFASIHFSVLYCISRVAWNFIDKEGK